MKWNQTMRRNAQGQIELKTTITREGEKDKVTVNIISESDAKFRIRNEDWQQMIDDDNTVYMQLTWEVPEEKPTWS